MSQLSDRILDLSSFLLEEIDKVLCVFPNPGEYHSLGDVVGYLYDVFDNSVADQMKALIDLTMDDSRVLNRCLDQLLHVITRNRGQAIFLRTMIDVEDLRTLHAMRAARIAGVQVPIGLRMSKQFLDLILEGSERISECYQELHPRSPLNWMPEGHAVAVASPDVPDEPVRNGTPSDDGVEGVEVEVEAEHLPNALSPSPVKELNLEQPPALQNRPETLEDPTTPQKPSPAEEAEEEQILEPPPGLHMFQPTSRVRISKITPIEETSTLSMSQATSDVSEAQVLEETSSEDCPGTSQPEERLQELSAFFQNFRGTSSESSTTFQTPPPTLEPPPGLHMFRPTSAVRISKITATEETSTTLQKSSSRSSSECGSRNSWTSQITDFFLEPSSSSPLQKTASESPKPAVPSLLSLKFPGEAVNNLAAILQKHITLKKMTPSKNHKLPEVQKTSPPNTTLNLMSFDFLGPPNPNGSVIFPRFRNVRDINVGKMIKNWTDHWNRMETPFDWCKVCEHFIYPRHEVRWCQHCEQPVHFLCYRDEYGRKLICYSCGRR